MHCGRSTGLSTMESCCSSVFWWSNTVWILVMFGHALLLIFVRGTFPDSVSTMLKPNRMTLPYS